MSIVLGFLCFSEDGVGLVGSAGGIWVGCFYFLFLFVIYFCLLGWVCLLG